MTVNLLASLRRNGKPFELGKTYRTLGGNMVTIIAVKNDLPGYETVQGDDRDRPESGHRYNRPGDLGRTTGTDHDWTDLRNLIPEPKDEIKRIAMALYGADVQHSLSLSQEPREYIEESFEANSAMPPSGPGFLNHWINMAEIAIQQTRENGPNFEAIKYAVDTAFNYISHTGANYTERGEPHPQQLLVDKLIEAQAELKKVTG